MNKKPKYMTPDNYLEFKPSEFIRSFAADVEVAIQRKLPMNMGAFVSTDPDCLPCLGGLACMNFGYDPIDDDEYGHNGNIPELLELLGDDIRSGVGSSAINKLQRLYDDYAIPSVLPYEQSITGILRTRELRQLQKRIHHYADLIWAAGY